MLSHAQVKAQSKQELHTNHHESMIPSPERRKLRHREVPQPAQDTGCLTPKPELQPLPSTTSPHKVPGTLGCWLALACIDMQGQAEEFAEAFHSSFRKQI